MEVAVLLALAAAIGIGVVVYRRRGTQPKPQLAPEPTVNRLDPGDVLNLNGGLLMVEAVLDCREELAARTTRWRWNFLEGGALLETAASGQLLYEPAEVVQQGTERFQQLVAEGGTLKTFEEQVRQVGSAPDVTFQHGDRVYSMRGTGTFLAAPAGAPPAQAVWGDVSPTASENVYFKMEASDGGLLLGVWTTHIALHRGRLLAAAEIAGIYPGSANSAAEQPHR